jgi:chromatin segregation and condensation protein Rec8/ScpA/Scc1 (kleisin family)
VHLINDLPLDRTLQETVVEIKSEQLNSKKNLIKSLNTIQSQNSTLVNPSEQENVSQLKHTLINQEQSIIIEKTNQKDFAVNSKNYDIKCLINDQDLSRVINRNPWDFNVKKSLESLQNRIYDNVYIKFRIGGKAIHSASQIVRAKSFLIIQESEETQNNLQINELDQEDLDTPEINVDASANVENLTESEVIANLKAITNENESDSLAKLAGIETSNSSSDFADQFGAAFAGISVDSSNLTSEPIGFFNIDASGEKFLRSPMREVYRKITFQDLGKALFKTLSYQLKSTHIHSSRADINICAEDILPESILKKAEEDRALVELQISKMFNRICELFLPDQPVSFLKLIITPNADGIVRTLLYLLHLVNRKQIEIWQKCSANIEFSDQISKKKKKTSDKEEDLARAINSSISMQEENAGTDIFITPVEINTKSE